MANITGKNWRVTVLGGGDRAAALEGLARQLKIADRVAFAGMVPNTVVRQHLRTTDLLVLPSNWDG